MEFRKMRRFKQQITQEECIEVLKKAPRGVLAMHGENGYPYAIPLNQYYDETDGKLYFHGSKSGLKLDLLKENDRVCFAVMDEGYVREGEWAKNISSVVCLGRMETVTDRGKVIEQCRKLAEKFYPEYIDTEKEFAREVRNSGAAVNVLCMTVDRMTGKLVNES